jgi:hypothetical protein
MAGLTGGSTSSSSGGGGCAVSACTGLVWVDDSSSSSVIGGGGGTKLAAMTMVDIVLDETPPRIQLRLPRISSASKSARCNGEVLSVHSTTCGKCWRRITSPVAPAVAALRMDCRPLNYLVQSDSRRLLQLLLLLGFSLGGMHQLRMSHAPKQKTQTKEMHKHHGICLCYARLFVHKSKAVQDNLATILVWRKSARRQNLVNFVF